MPCGEVGDQMFAAGDVTESNADICAVHGLL